MLENVRNLMAHDNGRTFATIKTHLEAIGYKVYAKVLNVNMNAFPKSVNIIFI